MTTASRAARGPGHLFVVQGRLEDIAADDVILPCDGSLNFTRGFRPLVASVEGATHGRLRPRGADVPQGFRGYDRPPVPLPPDDHERRAWFVNTASSSGDVRWLVSGMRTALDRIAEDVARRPRNGRERRLVALPLVGVGTGGYEAVHSEVLAQLHTTLRTWVEDEGRPDVVLMVLRRSDYAVLQHERRKAEAHDGRGPENELLGPVQDRLARYARSGSLVLFIGAGLSAAAGFPTWRELLRQLANPEVIPEPARGAVLSLTAPDAADVIERAIGGATVLQGKIVKAFGDRPYSLSHGILGSLRVSEAVTTNYDVLYEMAADLPWGGDLRVLPRQRLTQRGPWLLKLHGDTAAPGTIVLTRENYMRLDADMVPLMSVVQAQMMTRHMLFLGYSLSDENVIRLSRQVRQVLATASGPGEENGVDRQPVGTLISLFADPGRARLWEQDLDFVSFDPEMASSDDDEYVDRLATAARRQEIFLDGVALRACDDTPYLLDTTYNFLTEDQSTLRKALHDVAATLPSAGTLTETEEQVQRFLASLGWQRPSPDRAVPSAATERPML